MAVKPAIKQIRLYGLSHDDVLGFDDLILWPYASETRDGACEQVLMAEMYVS